jgi:hypothetical protein
MEVAWDEAKEIAFGLKGVDELFQVVFDYLYNI